MEIGLIKSFLILLQNNLRMRIKLKHWLFFKKKKKNNSVQVSRKLKSVICVRIQDSQIGNKDKSKSLTDITTFYDMDWIS